MYVIAIVTGATIVLPLLKLTNSCVVCTFGVGGYTYIQQIPTASHKQDNKTHEWTDMRIGK